MESTIAVSVRLPKSIVKKLRKKKDYTVWIKQLILAAFGICPICASKIKGLECHEPEGSR